MRPSGVEGQPRTQDERKAAPGLRSFPIGAFVLFYRQAARGIEVARILPGSRDIPSLFQAARLVSVPVSVEQ